MSDLRNLIPVIALVLGNFCNAQTQVEFELAAPKLDTGKKIGLWATHYHVYTARSNQSGVPFKDKSGKALSDGVSPRDWCLSAVQGTVQVSAEGSVRTLNYVGVGSQLHVDCAEVLKIDPTKKPWISSTGKSYFAPAIGQFGDGVENYKLVPYRTVAVDKSVIPYGTAIFIPKARGLEFKLPSGATLKHDGYFLAADKGGAIKGNHIDIFCGTSAKNCLPELIASESSKTFDAFLVQDAPISESLRKLHK
jgi:3D (Asp-Asp-Asp) domain-containing protein